MWRKQEACFLGHEIDFMYQELPKFVKVILDRIDSKMFGSGSYVTNSSLLEIEICLLKQLLINRACNSSH
jgi:hypothetical protein